MKRVLGLFSRLQAASEGTKKTASLPGWWKSHIIDPCGALVLIKACPRKQMKDGQFVSETGLCAKTGVLIRLFVQGDARSMTKACIA